MALEPRGQAANLGWPALEVHDADDHHERHGLGAGGGLGGAITAELAARGHLVTAVTRRGDAAVPNGVRTAAGTCTTPLQPRG